MPRRTRTLPLKITWTRTETTHPQAPVYIVVTAPPEVRFAGNGFIALAAGAPGPYEMKFGKGQSRALVAIHHKNGMANRGEFAITPYRSGSQTYAWAVVTAGACGEQIISQGTRAIEIAPGAAELVVQDRFSPDQPRRRIRSNDGHYDLLVFDGRFQAHDVATDSTILKLAGVDTNFSPPADSCVAAQIRRAVLDRRSRKRHDHRERSGSRLFGVGAGGQLRHRRRRRVGCGPRQEYAGRWRQRAHRKCGPARRRCVDIRASHADINRGFALVTGDFGWKIGDLFTRTTSNDDEVKPEPADALKQIRNDYDAGYAALPKIGALASA